MAYSSVMRYTGLSGVDTASMVDALMEAESYRYNKLYRDNITYGYQQDAYRSVGNNLLDIQKNYLDILSTNSLRKASTYTGSSTTVTDKYGNSSNAVSVTLGKTDSQFNSSMEVSQLATKDSVTIRGNGAGKAAEEKY